MEDFAATQSSIQAALVATTRTAASLASEDLQFHRSLEPSIGTQIDQQNARLLDLARRLLGSAVSSTGSQTAVCQPLASVEDVEDNWSKIVDSIDSLLERADSAMDEFTGAIKKLSQNDSVGVAAAKCVSGSHVQAAAKPLVSASKYSTAFRAARIDKPQQYFDRKINNYPEGPFKPLLTAKPHSTVPLQSDPTGDPAHYDQPYQHEIETYTYPASVHQRTIPVMYTDFDQTTSTFVDTEEALYDMLQELKQAKEIAVDLEHHDTRTYVGLTCLMQISTREKDWIVDTLVPWRHKLECLNEVFADPSILKVLHGAFMDIIWLQRDLGLYIVGLFDTYGAARSLGYSGCGYASLLRKFTGVEAQKKYQMADWRIRPLPKELLDYARSDTHYLLYVYDHMRNELVEASKSHAYTYERERVNDVLRRSKETALQRYEHASYELDAEKDPTGWYKLLTRTPIRYSREQFSVFRRLCSWRYNLARAEDESIHYILANPLLISLAKEMPTDKQTLLNVVPNGGVIFNTHREEILELIKTAKLEGADGPDMMDVLRQYDKKEPAEDNAGAAKQVTATTPPASDKAPTLNGGIASLLPLRSIKSMFWGAAINSAEQKRTMSTAPIVQLSVPMPAVGANIFAESPATPIAPVVVQEASSAAATPMDEDIFTLREMSKKRKLVPMEEGDIQLDDAESDSEARRALEKSERKRARKEAKRAAQGTASKSQAEEAFDYAAAPSMLTPAVQDKKKERKPKKSFDPYSKSLDAPRGLPRMQKESAGRSMTFSR